jgi:hypothetical protein
MDLASHTTIGLLREDVMATIRTSIRGQKAPSGMGRFFSSMNLDRYRKLVSGAIGEAEKHQLLKDLAEEMNAFRREVHGAADQASAFRENIGPHASGGI